MWLGSLGRGSTFSRRFLPFETKKVGDVLVQKLQEVLKLKVTNVQGFYLILFFFCVRFKGDEKLYDCLKQCSKCRLYHGKSLIRRHLYKKLDSMMSRLRHIPSYVVKLGHEIQIFIFMKYKTLCNDHLCCNYVVEL